MLHGLNIVNSPGRYAVYISYSLPSLSIKTMLYTEPSNSSVNNLTSCSTPMADLSSNNNTRNSSNNNNNNNNTSNTSTSIYHIPQFRYLPSIPWLTLQDHFEHLRSLQQKCLHPSTGKPYILSMRFGKNNSWENLGKGITHVAILEFASQEDLDYYLLRDEVHAEFSRQAMPLVEEVTVVDITDGDLFGPTPKKPIGLDGVYKGACHCRGCEWEVRVPKGEVLRHVLCHCDTCKRLSGGPYSCNYIVGREELRVKRGSPSVYTYQGASGESEAVILIAVLKLMCFVPRQGCPMLFLPELHEPYLSPSKCDARQDHCAYSPTGRRQRSTGWR